MEKIIVDILGYIMIALFFWPIIIGIGIIAVLLLSLFKDF